jgi:hypothetical protein
MRNNAHILLHQKGILQTYNVLVLSKMWRYVFIGVRPIHKTLFALPWLVAIILRLRNNALVCQTMMALQRGNAKQTVQAGLGVRQQIQAGFK